MHKVEFLFSCDAIDVIMKLQVKNKFCLLNSETLTLIFKIRWDSYT